MSNWLPKDKRRSVFDLLMQGRSVRQVAAEVGCSKVTVSHYRKLLAAIEFVGGDARLPKCECGQEAGHNGWCRIRYLRSPRRQEVLARWRRNQLTGNTQNSF